MQLVLADKFFFALLPRSSSSSFSSCRFVRAATLSASRSLFTRPSRLQKHGYIGDFEIVDDHRAGKIVVEVCDPAPIQLNNLLT